MAIILDGTAGIKSDGSIFENGSTISQDYTISEGKNAGSFGPITIADGISVTIPTGSTWSIV